MNIMKLAVNTNTNVIVYTDMDGKGYIIMRYSAPNSIARMSMVQMVRLCVARPN